MPEKISNLLPNVRGSSQQLFLISHNRENLYSVADKIKYARLSARLKSKEVAERAGMHITTYCHYERGEITAEGMDFHILERISEVCGFPKDFCFDEYQKFRSRCAEIIRKYMSDNGISNRQLADRAGVSLTSVKLWKSGKHCPSYKVWEDIFKQYTDYSDE